MGPEASLPTGGSAFSAIGALADPVRRRLYEIATGRDDGIGREEAARAAGVPTHTARFHLDKLVEEGLLAVDHRRFRGRPRPGAGGAGQGYRRPGTGGPGPPPPPGPDLGGRGVAAAAARAPGAASPP